MEDTAENHLALARFCYENKLLALAKKHIDLAIATDPEFVEQRRAQVPDLVEKFSRALLADAKEFAEKEEFSSAELAVSTLLEAFPETTAAAEGRKLLATLADTKVEREEAAKAAKVEKLADEAAKKAARERATRLAPIVDARTLGRKMVREGLECEGQAKAKGLFDQAIPQFKQTLVMIETLVKLNSGNAELLAEAEELRLSVVVESVHAHCLAGGVALSRGSYGEAQGYARRALAIDAESSEAQGFLVRVENAISSKDDIDERSRRPRAGGRGR
jgi:hypothetical protein